MVEHLELSQAVSKYVQDGDTVALEGFTHLIPFAAGHEIIRQGRRDLTLVRMTPDLIYDQMIGAGCVRKLLFSWGGNPGVGSLWRFRDAVENGWPVPLEIEEHSHAGLANRYAAGASGMPFTVTKSYLGTTLGEIAEHAAFLDCPFTGQKVTAIAAVNPDVGIVHAQRADRAGNVHIWGISGVLKEVVLASRRSIVTVEEVVMSWTAGPAISSSRRWPSTRSARPPAAPILRTCRTTTSATTSSTGSGWRSARSGTASWNG